MLRAQRLTVPRGQAITIPLDIQVGSPSTLVFTLATERNCATKLWTGTPVSASPAYEMTVPADETNRAPCVYWWDVWDTENSLLLALGSLEIQGVVRLP